MEPMSAMPSTPPRPRKSSRSNTPARSIPGPSRRGVIAAAYTPETASIRPFKDTTPGAAIKANASTGPGWGKSDTRPTMPRTVHGTAPSATEADRPERQRTAGRTPKRERQTRQTTGPWESHIQRRPGPGGVGRGTPLGSRRGVHLRWHQAATWKESMSSEATLSRAWTRRTRFFLGVSIDHWCGAAKARTAVSAASSRRAWWGEVRRPSGGCAWLAASRCRERART